jgi:hypothetical protein
MSVTAPASLHASVAPPAPRAALSAFVPRLLLASAIAAAMVLIGQALWCTFRFRDVFPFADMVGVVWHYLAAPMREFWIYHDNEHLPLAVMPLFWIDLRLFHAQGLFLIVCNVALASAIALAPAPAMRRALGQSSWLLAALVATSLSMQLWLAGWENLTWPKQVHMYMSLMAAVLAIGVAASPRPRGWGHVAAAAALAGIATFSFGYGMIAFPVVLVLGLWRGWDWRRLAAVAVAMVCCLAAYLTISAALVGQRSHLIMTYGRLENEAHYFLTFMASPAYTAVAPVLPSLYAYGLSYSLVGLGLGWLAWRIWQTRGAPPSELLAWAAGLTLFSLLTGVQTALGRSVFGSEQALESRYIVGELPFWCGLLLLAADQKQLRTRGGQALAGSVALAAMLLLLLSQQTALARLRVHNADRWMMAMSAIDGVSDPPAENANEWSHPGRFHQMIADLRLRGWSAFAWPQAKWIGRGLGSFGAAQKGCLGAFDALDPVGDGSGFRAQGWAADSAVRAHSAWVVMADRTGLVRGVAHGGGVRPDVSASLHAPGLLYAGWTGYLPAGAGRQGLSAWLLLGGKHPCFLGAVPPKPA